VHPSRGNPGYTGLLPGQFEHLGKQLGTSAFEAQRDLVRTVKSSLLVLITTEEPPVDSPASAVHWRGENLALHWIFARAVLVGRFSLAPAGAPVNSLVASAPGKALTAVIPSPQSGRQTTLAWLSADK
jgi:hypothetical protein